MMADSGLQGYTKLWLQRFIKCVVRVQHAGIITGLRPQLVSACGSESQGGEQWQMGNFML